MSALSRRGEIHQQLIVLSEDTKTYPANALPDPLPCYMNYRLRHSDWLGIMRTVRHLRNRLLRDQIELLHTHLLDADIIGALACQGTPCRHLSHIRGTSEWLTSNSWRDRLRRWYYRRAFEKAGTFFAAVSKSSADHTQLGLKIPVDRVRVVLNGINPERFPDNRVSESDDGLFRIGSAGRFAPEKGYGDLIAAVGLLRSRYPQLRLILAGQGGLQGEYEATFRQLGLEGICQLSPPVEDMNSFLRGLDLFVLPSLRAEGLSRALMEAMYCKRPVIASRVSGSEESIVDQRTGLIFEPGDVAGLARQIERLVNSPEELHQLGKAAGEFAAEKFTVDRVAAQIEAIYRELVPASSRAVRGLV